jgi:hypothetical protein
MYNRAKNFMNKLDTRQLLCTFTNSNDFRTVEEELQNFYNIYNKRIFAFVNNNNSKEVYLTYNVLDMQRGTPKFPNTILIHRKKQFNVLYSLNALNTLIKKENGKLDPSFILDWALYSNSLVISGDVSVRIIPIKILDVF